MEWENKQKYEIVFPDLHLLAFPYLNRKTVPVVFAQLPVSKLHFYGGMKVTFVSFLRLVYILVL